MAASRLIPLLCCLASTVDPNWENYEEAHPRRARGPEDHLWGADPEVSGCSHRPCESIVQTAAHLISAKPNRNVDFLILFNSKPGGNLTTPTSVWRLFTTSSESRRWESSVCFLPLQSPSGVLTSPSSSLQLSPAIVGGLHNMARSIESRCYAEGLNIHTHIVSSSNFSETSAFMPVLKVVLTQANKLGVWTRCTRPFRPGGAWFTAISLNCFRQDNRCF